MSLPLTRYKRNKIFYPQQGKSQNNLILRCEKVILFWTATQSDLTFLSDGKYVLTQVSCWTETDRW